MQKAKRKGRWLRRIVRLVIGLILFIIIACFVFDHFVQFRKSDEYLSKFFSENHIVVKNAYYTSHDRKIHYISAGNDSLPVLLMIHGAPSSASNYRFRFVDSIISHTFKIIAVDRPGYGNSGFGHPESSIQKQAEIIRPLLDSINKARHPVIIVGGSYGAAIACRIAMDHPELVDGLVLSGPALAPGKEKTFGISYIMEYWAVRWFVPRMFKSANTEKLHHKEELEKMLPYWKNIHVPVMYLQGARDKLIDTSNLSFAKQQLVNVPYFESYFFSNRGHYLGNGQWPVIRNYIMKMYEMIKNKY